MHPLTKYAFEPYYRTTYHSGITDTEVCVTTDPEYPGILIISFYGMNSVKDALFTPPIYIRQFGKWCHVGTYHKFLSVLPFLSSQIAGNDIKNIFLTGFSMGGAIAMICRLWLKEKHPEITVSHSILAPYKSVIDFDGLVHVVDKDLFPRWPFLVPAHKNKLVYESPYKWHEVLKNHFYLRDIVTNKGGINARK